jgi:hypothetical protein
MSEVRGGSSSQWRHRSEGGDGALALTVEVALSKGTVDVRILNVVGVPGGG